MQKNKIKTIEPMKTWGKLNASETSSYVGPDN